MPRFPNPAPGPAALRSSVFTLLAPHFARARDPVIPLHIGDTYLPPPAAASWTAAADRMPARSYTYRSPNGEPALRDAFCERWAGLGLHGLEPERVHVTVGATGGVAAALRTWLAPGDEVLLLAPYWPLVRGIVRAAGGVPVDVPFYAAVRDGGDVRALLDAACTERTTAVYVITPNNPDGTALDAETLDTIAAWCVERDLWVLSDEAYADYVFAPNAHGFLANRPGMAARTATVYTVSKSYALAGARVGLLVGDPAWLDIARRVTTHDVYNVPLIAQTMAEAAIRTGDDWVRDARARYQQAAHLVAQRLELPFAPAQGGGYVFVDLGAWLPQRAPTADGDRHSHDAANHRDDPMLGLLVDLIHAGVSLSPGGAFGAAWGDWARLCFMSVPEGELGVAVDRLNRFFAARPRLRTP